MASLPAARHTLWVHDAKFSPEDLLLKADAFPKVQRGDIVELHNPDADPDDSCRLLLLVESALDVNRSYLLFL